MTTTFTGQYGIVLLPDNETAAKARGLGAALLGNELDVGGVHPAHLTLYHLSTHGLPGQMVSEILTAVSKRLPLVVSLGPLQIYGSKFWFWDATIDGDLEMFHHMSLQLMQFIDRNTRQQADKEGLDLSSEERDNVNTFGHPLVKRLWRPHITIGYCSAGISDEMKGEMLHEAVFNRVAFVRVGDFGSVAEIVMEL